MILVAKSGVWTEPGQTWAAIRFLQWGQWHYVATWTPQGYDIIQEVLIKLKHTHDALGKIHIRAALNVPKGIV